MKILNSEITPYNVYLNRRKFIKSTISASIASSIPLALRANHSDNSEIYNKYLDDNDKLNKFSEITSYNNFYEFWAGKGDPAKYSNKFKPSPWSITFEGLVNKPKTIDLDEILNKITIEDRVYRLRCVEAWSMVIPWQGFPLSNLIKIAEPLNSAKFIEFETIFRPEEMPAQKTKLLPWPYVEALRIDEAMNPLTILSTGLYGHKLPNQNGSPIRLVVPWKYGFKSIKSILISGMAKTTYHVFEDSIYQAKNNASGDTIIMRFNDNELTQLNIIGGSTGEYLPDSISNDINSPIT